MPTKTKASKPTGQRTPKKAAVPAAPQPRRLAPPQYRSFRLHKRIKPTQSKLPSSFTLFRKSLRLLKNNKKLFAGLIIIYGLLTVILVRGFAGGVHLGDIKSSFQEAFQGKWSSVTTAAVLFGSLLGSAGTSSTETGGVYQAWLMILVALVTIWTVRQRLAKKSVRVRDGFYKGMYPLIPFVLVLAVIGLQLLPLGIGNWLYSTVVANGIAVTGVEKALWLLFFALLALLSLYMICSSLFALYIVTLPDMTPLKALRSARQLVLHRRWTVMRKVILLPLFLLLLSALIMTPLLLFATAAAEWVFFLLTMVGWIVTLTYLYMLYRELLNE